MWPLNTLLGKVALSSLTHRKCQQQIFWICLYFSIMFTSAHKTALVQWVLFYSLVVLAPIIVLKRNGHTFEMGFVHITFNLVFGLKINEAYRLVPRYWEVDFLCAWSRPLLSGLFMRMYLFIWFNILFPCYFSSQKHCNLHSSSLRLTIYGFSKNTKSYTVAFESELE